MNPPLAEDIMVTKLVTVPPTANVLDAVRLLVKHSISGVPVIDAEGNYSGVFSEKCCMRLYDSIAQAARQQRVALPTLPDARQIMSTKLVTLHPDSDVVPAIGDLLKNHISGAPVVDSANRFLGVFSEKTSMSVLIQAAYEQLPSTKVSAFMNTDFGRTILEDEGFMGCVKLFLDTPYRRLPVLRGDSLVGQVSRRDVLRNSMALISMVGNHEVILDVSGASVTENANPPQVTTPNGTDRVHHFMDVDAETITEEVDLLRIAQLFFETPYRRLPVLRDGKLVGQVSRRDVLSTTHRMMEVVPRKESSLLYLSALGTAFQH